MVIDDDMRYLRALERVFAQHSVGFDVDVRDDASAAIDALRERPVDLVLVDRYMEGIDGIELCRALRAQRPWMTVVVSSGHVTRELRWEALRAGASRVLPKPVTPEGVHATLVEALSAVESARAMLIGSHLDLARAIAARMSSRYRTLISDDDIETLATIGLCEAAARFDPFRQQTFAAFATHRIRGAIIDGVRRLTAQTRRRHERKRLYSEVRSLLAASGTADVSPEMVAAQLAIEVDDLDGVEDPNRVTYEPLASEPAADEDGPGALVEQHELRDAIRAARQQLPELEASLVDAHYDLGMSLAEIARSWNIGQRRIEQLHARALASLRRLLDTQV